MKCDQKGEFVRPIWGLCQHASTFIISPCCTCQRKNNKPVFKAWCCFEECFSNILRMYAMSSRHRMRTCLLPLSLHAFVVDWNLLMNQQERLGAENQMILYSAHETGEENTLFNTQSGGSQMPFMRIDLKWYFMGCLCYTRRIQSWHWRFIVKKVNVTLLRT